MRCRLSTGAVSPRSAIHQGTAETPRHACYAANLARTYCAVLRGCKSPNLAMNADQTVCCYQVPGVRIVLCEGLGQSRFT